MKSTTAGCARQSRVPRCVLCSDMRSGMMTSRRCGAPAVGLSVVLKTVTNTTREGGAPTVDTEYEVLRAGGITQEMLHFLHQHARWYRPGLLSTAMSEDKSH